MSTKIIFHFALLLIAGVVISACVTSRQAKTGFSNGVDSIKVKVSTPLSSNHVLLTGDNKAFVKLKGKQKSSLSNKEAKKLNTLANDLFVKRTSPIIISVEKASGRTCHSIFTVTTYRDGKSESKRYDMGDEADGITQCTTKNIRYSDPFREFMFAMFHILK